MTRRLNLTPPPRMPWLRTTGNTPVIEITNAARRVILEEARKSPFLETGGALGSAELLPSPLRIDIARGPTESVARRRHSVTLHRGELEDSCGDHVLCGDWHSHPTGDIMFSTTDLESWASMRASCRRPPRQYVAIICAPDPNEPDPVRGWRTPNMRAWVIGRDYYQPARLVAVATTNTTAKPRPARAGDNRKAKPIKHDGMLIASRSFTCIYDGDTVEITAGRDYVIPGHPIARAHPDRFKAA